MYELNEVPWAIVDWYTANRPNSNIAKIVAASRNYTTVTTDQGELHPWVTWPTLHRGVDNTVHKIEFLNQDLTSASAYPPLWETAAQAGKNVGVFGSLQSYPVPRDQQYAFYVPDTFAPAADAHPPVYEALQELNLRQTASDGGIVSAVKIDGSVAKIFLRLFNAGLSVKTVMRLAKQIALERRNPAYKTRRAVLQAPVAFDVFLHAYNRSRPDLCTFFTNHVAGMMHRYWKHALSSDESEQRRDPVRASNIAFAMDVADEQIGVLRRLADKAGASLVISSSMGQAPIDRRGGDQLRITDMSRFVQAVGFQGTYTSHLAMHPDFNFSFETPADAEQFAAAIARLRFSDGRPVAYKSFVCGSTVNIGVAQPGPLQDHDWLTIDQSGRRVPFAEAGLLRFARDVGTAYHVPEGIMIWYNKGQVPDLSRPVVDSSKVRPMILGAIGVEDPRMHGLASEEMMVA
ncbi:hypothetical protein [Croceibacterium ferulae]|uniref:hypothetical protein n=1 Tax=Croceibacterium ferulae TaxID=1854641 RepID=UPI000F87DFF0|nr:hypothetical protein [Croceibacterium ferulae]